MWGVALQCGKRENKGDGQVDIVDGASRLIESSDDLRLQLSFNTILRPDRVAAGFDEITQRRIRKPLVNIV
jgi:hypothetical protein